ncbi:hypothetical protein PN36_17440 [Candidatus Thiomargarita nelsonii]|uniref:Radical SAM core domain-containing protein n=1 Tax=Candidatus Thiomargarita nelsonii TaxID=1003181 RepID=A0A0A6PJ45_9GAMM|nr:hypothetical protein PN36_17440 [Candidatus Thiomargarita nelsonii]
MNKKLFSVTLGQFLNKLQYKLWHKYAKDRTIIPWQPLALSIVATGLCNLKCTMCPTHSTLIPKDYKWRQTTLKNMDFETFKLIVDRFNQAISVQIIGSGEPLLNKDLFKMVEYASVKRRMQVATISNGTLINRKINDLISSPLDNITISLNGHNEQEYERLNAAPLFTQVYGNIKKLVEARDAAGSKLEINTSFIIDQQNYRLIPEFIKTGEDLGVDHIFLYNFLPSPYDGFRVQERTLLAHDQEVVEFLKTVVPERLRGKVFLPTLLDLEQQDKKCRVHTTTLRVDADKNYSACPIMLLNMEGDKKITDPQVWNSEFFQEMRSRFISPNKDDLHDPCKVCTQNYGVECPR